MPSFSERVESFFGIIFGFLKSSEKKLFTKSRAFKNHPEPTMAVIGPLLSRSGSALDVDFTSTPAGQNRFPVLKWDFGSAVPNRGFDATRLNPSHSTMNDAYKSVLYAPRATAIVEWILVVEDPDVPLPSPVIHGVYYGIPGSKTSVKPDNFKPMNGAGGNNLQGGFKYGVNCQKSIWCGPNPMLDHGQHRYMFQVVGLNKAVEGLSDMPTKQDIEKAIVGKVVKWGVWIGTFERTLD